MKRRWLKRLWQFLRPHAPALAGAAALAAAAGLLALLVPLFSGWAVGAVGTEAGQVRLRQVAACCAGAACPVKGCPPTAEAILAVLKEQQ